MGESQGNEGGRHSGAAEGTVQECKRLLVELQQLNQLLMQPWRCLPRLLPTIHTFTMSCHAALPCTSIPEA